MDCIKNEMLGIKADGVVFVPIMHPSLDIRDGEKPIHCEFTFAEWCEGDGSHPKSAREYYKIINGNRLYYDYNLKKYR